MTNEMLENISRQYRDGCITERELLDKLLIFLDNLKLSGLESFVDLFEILVPRKQFTVISINCITTIRCYDVITADNVETAIDTVKNNYDRQQDDGWVIVSVFEGALNPIYEGN